MEPRTFRSYEPDQILLLPPSLRDWLPGVESPGGFRPQALADPYVNLSIHTAPPD
jgi:hypothetical protein